MIKRHDLLIIKNKIIPGIVKRQEKVQDDWIEIGISYPIKIEGQRIREISKIEVKDVKNIVTPYDILEIYRNRELRIDILDELIILLEKKNKKIGIFGSLALMIYTGFSYFEKDSDIDIIIKNDSKEVLEKIYKEIKILEKKYDKKIDVEIEFENGYSFKLKEYFRFQKTILLKGLYDAKLIETEAI